MIELTNVSFTYPSGVDALGGILLQVERRELVVLCGPSGCGKSTLLMTINGLIPHSVEGRRPCRPLRRVHRETPRGLLHGDGRRGSEAQRW